MRGHTVRGRSPAPDAEHGWATSTGGADAPGGAAGVRRAGSPARRGLGSAHGDRAGPTALDGAVRAAGLGQDDAGADGGEQLGRGVRGAERGAGRSCGGARGDRAGRAPAENRQPARPDRAVPGRDPPLQQGPAGRAAAGRRGRVDHADRGDDREPGVRGQRRAALARARVCAAGALHRGGRDGAAPRGGRGDGCRRRTGGDRGRTGRGSFADGGGRGGDRVPGRAQRRRRAHGAERAGAGASDRG